MVAWTPPPPFRHLPLTGGKPKAFLLPVRGGDRGGVDNDQTTRNDSFTILSTPMKKLFFFLLAALLALLLSPGVEFHFGGEEK